MTKEEVAKIQMMCGAIAAVAEKSKPNAAHELKQVEKILSKLVT